MTAALVGSLLSTVTLIMSVLATPLARTGSVDPSRSCTSFRTSSPWMSRTSFSEGAPGVGAKGGHR